MRFLATPSQMAVNEQNEKSSLDCQVPTRTDRKFGNKSGKRLKTNT
jgi:hypothetical protein